MAEPLILVAGVPAAGKSHFAEWLRSEKGFTHLDVDEDYQLRSFGLEEEWGRCLHKGDVTRFVDTLRKRKEPQCLDWGFHASSLEIAKALKDAGFSCWWFNADYGEAKKAYMRRGEDPLISFEIQVKSFVEEWGKIEMIFSPNILMTLDSKGIRLSAEEIFDKVMEKLKLKSIPRGFS